MMDVEDEPWGLGDDDCSPRYRPATEDITDDEDISALTETRTKLSQKHKNNNSVLKSSHIRSPAPYKCNSCVFKTDDFMVFITHRNEHVEKKEKMKSLFTCGMCEFTTPKPELMSRHIQSHLLVSLTTPSDNLNNIEDTQQDVPCESSAQLMEKRQPNFDHNILIESSEDITIAVSKLIDYVETTSIPNLGNMPNTKFLNCDNNEIGVLTDNDSTITADDDTTTTTAQCAQPSDEVEISEENDTVFHFGSVFTEEGWELESSELLPSINLETAKGESIEIPAEDKAIIDVPNILVAKICDEIIDLTIENVPSQEEILETSSEPLKYPKVKKPKRMYGKQSKRLPADAPIKTTVVQSETVTKAVVSSSMPATPLQVMQKQKESHLASDALIGYLELRRVQSVSPENMETEASKNPPATSAQPLVLKTTIAKADKGLDKFTEAKHTVFKYKHPERVGVSFHTNKNKIIATARGVKTIQPMQTSPLRALKVTSDEKIVNSVKKTTPELKASAKSKLVVSKVTPSSTLSQVRSELKRSTRSFSRLQVADSNGTNISSETATASKQLKKAETDETIHSAVETPNILPISAMDVDSEKENSKDQANKESVDPLPVYLPNRANESTASTPLDIISNGSENRQSTLEEVAREVKSSQEFMKPKKDILFRYQQEISRSKSADPEETLDQLECGKIVDLVSSEFSIEVSTTACSTIEEPIVNEIKSTEAGNLSTGSPCKIVLLRCPSVDTSSSSTLMASKLKSSLQDWKNIAMKKSIHNSSTLLQNKRKAMALNRMKAKQIKPFTAASKFPRVRNRYRCEFCIFTARDAAQLAAHSYRLHSKEENMYICEICDYISSRQSKLTAHMRIHKPAQDEGEKIKPKEQLVDVQVGIQNGKSANQTSKNLAHVIKDVCEAGENGLNLQIVNVRTLADGKKKPGRPNNFWNLYQTTGIKITDRPFACKICPYRARKLYNLQIHERSHTGDQLQYPCRYCQYSAARWKTFVQHQLLCHKDRPLSCYTCDFTCSEPRILKTHRFSKHRERPPILKCDLCSLQYTRKDMFQKHYLSHSGLPEMVQNQDRPFRCNMCPFVAKGMGGLKKHMPVHAAKKTVFHCRSCQFKTHVRSMLLRHTNQSSNCFNPQLAPKKILTF